MTSSAFRERWKTLTPKQRRTMRDRCLGLGRVETAAANGVAPATVKNHLRAGVQRMGINALEGGWSHDMASFCFRLGREVGRAEAMRAARPDGEEG